MLNPRERLTKARMILQRKNPFFSYLTMYLYFCEDEIKSIGSIGIDIKGNVYYNPDFIKKLNDDEIQGILCHEVLHLVLQHLKRRCGRDGKIWNLACDIVVNNILINNNFKLPLGSLIPYNNKINVFGIEINEIDKKTAEKIFDEISRKINSVGDYNFDNHIIDSDVNESKNEVEERSKNSKVLKGKKQKNEKNNDEILKKDELPDWKRILAEAYQFAKNMGTKLNGIDRYVNEIMFPKQNWLHLLKRYIISEIPFDYSYIRPSKKSYATGIYMPHIKKEMLDIAIAIDTSSSIDNNKDLKEFLNQVLGILKNFNSIRLTLICCDNQIQAIYELNKMTEKDILSLNLKGGGGTSFKPPIEWIKNNKPNIKVLIYFTDGYGDIVDLNGIHFNIIWLITKDGIDDLVKDKGIVIKIND